MKNPHFTPVALVALFAFACLLIPAHVTAQSAADTGAVTGRVSNAGTGNYLAAVQVRDKATGRTVYTDDAGSFELFNLPAGERTLVLEYTGLDTQEVAVTVTAGQRATRDVALTSADYDRDVVQLEKFVVAGEREGRSASIALQKASDVLVDVLSADEFPNVAGGNIGDFLRNLPGINVEYSGSDPRSISIRGMDPEMTAVNINGMRAANAASGGTSRTFELDQTSLQDVESIEIFKTPTASHDADSGAGLVNMKSKSAFTLKGRRISFQAGGSGNSERFGFGRIWHADGYRRGIRPAGNFSYQNSFFHNTLGVTFTANVNDYYGFSKAARDNHNTDLSMGALTSSGWGEGATPVIYPRSMQYSKGGGFSRRTSFSLNLDYRLSPHWTLRSTNQVNTSLISSVTPGLNLTSSAYNPGAGIAGTTNGIIADGLSPESSTAVTSGGSIRANTIYDAANSLSNTYASTGAEILHKIGHGTTFGLAAEYKRDRWWFNIQGSVSQSTNRYMTPDDMPISQATFYLRGIDYRIDHPAGADLPLPTQLNGLSIYDLTNYVSHASTTLTENVQGTGVTIYDQGAMSRIPGISTTAQTYPTVKREGGLFGPATLQNSRWNAGKDKFAGAKFDLRRHFSSRGFLDNMYAQAGASYRRQDRNTNQDGRTRWNFNGTTEELQQMLSAIAVPGEDWSFGPYQSVPVFSLPALNDYFRAHPEKLTEDVVYRADQEAGGHKDSYEGIIAGYAMLNTKLWSRLNLLVGMRWERTVQGSTGAVINNDAARDRAMEMLMAHVRSYGYADITSAYADTALNPLSGQTGKELVDNFTVTQAQALELTRLRYTTASVEKTYSDFYPNIQLKYYLTANLILRAAYNESIARQKFDQLLSGYILNVDSSNTYSITMNNPDLKPVYFHNYDVAAEYYTRGGGNFKLGWFLKDFENFTMTDVEMIEAGVLYGGYDFSEYAGSMLTRPRNVGGGRQWGIEASFSQRLDSLARVLRGISVMGSFTWQKGETDSAYGDDTSASDIAARPAGLPVKNMVPKMLMLGFSYNRAPVSASIKYNWKDDYFNGNMTSGGRHVAFQYRKARGQIDAALSCRVFGKYDLYAEIRNLTNEPDIIYMHKPEWVLRYDRYGAAIYFGIKATL
jgi:TonB-dependent receptor